MAKHVHIHIDNKSKARDASYPRERELQGQIQRAISVARDIAADAKDDGDSAGANKFSNIAKELTALLSKI